MRERFLAMAGPVALAAAAVLLLGGCAVSNSVQSISKSVSSPFEWSSSSSGASASTMYREDVERLIRTHLQAGADVTALRRDVAELAREQGVTDWADDEPTLRGIDAGLRAAGLDTDARRAFTAQLLGDDSDALLRIAEHPAR